MINDHNKFIILLVIGCSVFLSGCGGSYDAEKAYWHVGEEHATVIQNPKNASEKDFHETVDELRKVISGHPSWEKAPELQFYIGEMFASRGDYKTAREEFAKVYFNFPQSYALCARALFSEGLMQERLNDWKNAVKTYNEVIERYPSTPAGLEVPLYVAKRYRDKNDLEESEKAFDRAVRDYLNLYELNPYGQQVPALQYLLITAYANRRKWDEAVEVLEKMASKYPKSEGAPIALYRTALLYRDVLKQPNKAMTVYRRIIKDYPKSKLGKNVQLQIGNLSILQGDIEQTQKEFNKIFDKYPDDTSLCASAQLSVAVAYEKSGRWDEALREYRKLQTNYPTTNEAMQAPLFVAQHYIETKKTDEAAKILDEAIAYYKGVISKKPGMNIEPAAYEFLANAYGMQGRWQDTIDTLLVIRQKYSGTPRAAISLLKIGVIYQEKLNDNMKAKEVYTMFTHEYPNHNLTNLVRSLAEKIDQ